LLRSTTLSAASRKEGEDSRYLSEFRPKIEVKMHGLGLFLPKKHRFLMLFGQKKALK
jgi:hypothetical protein